MNRRLDFFIGVPLIKILRLFSGKGNRNITIPKKILVIKLAAIGDTILLIPVLRALKKSHSDLKIHWLASKINIAIAETVPYVDKLIQIENFEPHSILSLITQFKKEQYDMVIDFEQWARGTAILSFFSGAPVKIGFDTPGQHRSGLFTHTVRKEFDRHELSDFFRLLPKALEVKEDLKLELWQTENGKEEINRICPQILQWRNTVRVLIHPGCGRDGKPREWSLPNYAVLINWLIKKYNAAIFLSGGPDEIKKTQDLNKLVSNQVTNLGGQLSWQGMVSLVENMDLVISGNTGVMHIAAALAKPQVALHGPTNPKIWGPLNPKAKILTTSCPQCPSLKLGFEYHERTQSCMDKIEVDRVKDAVSAIIDNDRKIL